MNDPYDFVGELVEAGEAEDEVGAEERVDVLHVELAVACRGAIQWTFRI